MPDLVKAVIYSTSGVDEWGIDETLQYIDSGTGNGSGYLIGHYGLIEYVGISGCNPSANTIPLAPDDSCPPCPGPPTPPPGSVDPPLPPIWPYPTGNIYQRDHWNMNMKMIRARTFIFKAIAFNDGARVNLTGCTLTFTAKWETTDGVGLIVADNGGTGGITVTDAVNGEFTVEITPAQTDIAAIPYHRIDLQYDVELLNVASQKFSLLQGTIVVFPNITA
jgi:hypothetical protein